MPTLWIWQEKGLLCNSHSNPFILVQYQQCFNGTDDLLDLANVSHNKEITSCITLVLTGVTGSWGSLLKKCGRLRQALRKYYGLAYPGSKSSNSNWQVHTSARVSGCNVPSAFLITSQSTEVVMLLLRAL